MRWLVGETSTWLIIAALLGVLTTVLATVRPRKVTRPAARTTSAAAAAEVADSPASAAAADDQAEEASPDASEPEATTDEAGPAPEAEPEPEVEADPEPEAEPEPEDEPEGASDEDEPQGEIKGTASKKYHGPESPYYGRSKAKVWFKTAEEAEAAGYTKGWKS